MGRWLTTTPLRAELVPRVDEHGAERALDEVELFRPRDQRRRELHDRIAAIVGAADEAGFVETRRHETAEEPIAVLLRKGLLRGLIAHELDRPEETSAAHVADDRYVAQAEESSTE